MKPPILVLSVLEKPLLLYLTTIDTAMGALLAHYPKETRKENVIYYINKKMLPYEEKYSPLEKTCVALVWATRKLRHYILAYKVLLIARMDPLKYLMEKPVQVGKTTKWVLLLSEFDIKVGFGYTLRFPAFSFLFFFFLARIFPNKQLLFMNSTATFDQVTHKYHFSATFLLKMGPTVLFTRLKIILL